MFLNNYWKVKAAMDSHPRVYYNGNIHTLGYLIGVKNVEGTSENLYIATTYSTTALDYSDIVNQAGKQDRLLTVDNAVLIATGDHTISADDYAIGGTNITSNFSNLSLSCVVNSELGGEVYTFTVTGTYTGSSSVVIRRIGITKKLHYNSVADAGITSVYTTPVLLIEHELESPIALNQGDPINIILKVTQQ